MPAICLLDRISGFNKPSRVFGWQSDWQLNKYVFSLSDSLCATVLKWKSTQFLSPYSCSKHIYTYITRRRAAVWSWKRAFAGFEWALYILIPKQRLRLFLGNKWTKSSVKDSQLTQILQVVLSVSITRAENRRHIWDKMILGKETILEMYYYWIAWQLTCTGLHLDLVI